VQLLARHAGQADPTSRILEKLKGLLEKLEPHWFLQAVEDSLQKDSLKSIRASR
jgi:hypothetical protein